MSRYRADLAAAAAALYPQAERVEGTSLLANSSWTPSGPVPLDRISLVWGPDVPAPMLNGGSEQARHVLPPYAPGRFFRQYSSAIRHLDRPRLFENRPSYRLTAVDWERATLSFAATTY